MRRRNPVCGSHDPHRPHWHQAEGGPLFPEPAVECGGWTETDVQAEALAAILDRHLEAAPEVPVWERPAGGAVLQCHWDVFDALRGLWEPDPDPPPGFGGVLTWEPPAGYGWMDLGIPVVVAALEPGAWRLTDGDGGTLAESRIG